MPHDTDFGRTEPHSPPDAGRRRFLRTVGAGALASGLVCGAPAVAAQDGESGPETEAIDDWSIERLSGDSPADEPPTVATEDEEVVVSGTFVANDTCYAVRPVRLVYSADMERLGVVLEKYSRGGVGQACAQVVLGRAYELRVTPAELPESVVVEEQFSDAGRTVHYPGDEPGPELPPGVADYALEVGDSVAGSEAREIGPSVTFDGSDAVVEGALTYGSSSCNEIGVASVDLVDGASGEVAVTVSPQPPPTMLPDDPCTPDVAAAGYSLTLTAAEGTSIDRVVATEEGRQVTQETDATRETDPGEEPDLPPEVADYEFEWGEDLDVGIENDDASAVEPRVRFTNGDVVVEGAVEYGSPTCDEIAVTGIGRVYDTAGHVSVDVEARSRPDYSGGCDDVVSTASYRLRLIGSDEEPIDRCTVHESGQTSDHDLTVEETDDQLSYPETVSGHRLVIDRLVDRDGLQADVESPPTVRAETAEDGSSLVVVEGTASAGSSSCGTLHVGELVRSGDGASGGQTELQVGVVETRHRTEIGACTDDGVYADYRLEVAVDALPDVVTASEQPRTDGAARETTVELDGEGDELELPPDVHAYNVTLEQGVSSEEVESSPSIVTAAPGADPDIMADPVVQIDGALVVGPCESFELVDVRWEDDEQSHLAVTVDAATDESMLDDSGECMAGAPAVRTGYTVELEVLTLPNFVTAEEQLDQDGEPVRSTTQGIGACPDSRSIDGQSVCDLDGDGLFMDVTGDGSVDNVDVVEFFQVQHREAWKRPELFDFSGNDAVGHGDVVALFEHAASTGV